MSQLGFYHNNNECVGCKACVIACKDKNNLPLGEKYRRVYDYANCDWDVDEQGVCVQSNYYAYSVSIACNHCAAPACLASCPVGAIIKREEDGIVYIDAEGCIGCDACISACPYGEPYLSKLTNVAHKCDFCMDLIDQGEVPQCVAACSTRCLNFGDLEELKAMYPEGVATVPPITDSLATGPSVVFSRSRLNLDGKSNGVVTSTDEELASATV